MSAIINRLPWCSAKRVGVITFIRVGRLRVSVCMARRVGA